MRPHIEELLRLYPHFRIGVFSSATVRTVNQALDTLHAALQSITAHKGIGARVHPSCIWGRRGWSGRARRQCLDAHACLGCCQPTGVRKCV